MKYKIGFLVAYFVLIVLNLQAQSTKTIEERIDSILPLLTFEEKVAMCHAQSKFSSPGVGRLGIPEIWMSDGPHGVRAEMAWDNWSHAGWTNDSITAFPALTCLAATFNKELAYDYGVAVGEEALYREKDILLGPGVNIYRTPLNGRNFEYMGEDPYLASKMVVPYVKGVQSNNVAACVKHFVLNNQEHWRDHINVEVSDRALYEIYLPAFKAAVQEGEAWSIMSAYNQYQGQFCAHNEKLNNILKKDWGFDGVMVSDWGAAHNTRQSALYGLDIEMGTWTDGLSYSKVDAFENYYLAAPFKQLLRSGEVPMSVLDEKVRRILRLMYRTNMSENSSFGSINSVAHQEVGRKVGQEGIVLLKNDEEFFPIDPDKKMTIAVIGENAIRSMTVGGGSSELKPKYEISPLEGIKKRFSNSEILHTLGYASGPPVYANEIPSPYNVDSLKTLAISYAKRADVVLFIGGLNKNHRQDCEGGDRKSYDLPFGQNDLLNDIIKANANTGVILVSGNAVAMPWNSSVKAVMQAWYLGSETGNALASVISGDVNPSGKLPFTFPKELKDNAAHSFGVNSYPGDSITQHYKEGILVGYRWHETKNIKPQYAFGHGLSYTQFELDNIQLNKKSFTENGTILISGEVKNTGKIDGKEVVQIYVGKKKSKVERAVKELKGYEKITVESGKSKQFQISISVNDLAFYNESISDWEVEKGEYQLYIGNSSDNITSQLEITVK